MKAVILAGGRGTRLAPYTTVFPKPLMPLDDKPILEIVIRQLAYHGFNEITLTVGYLAEMFQTFFGDGERFGVEITYSREETPLGTAGPISLVGGLDDTFLVMNGDVLTTIDFTSFLAHHRESGGIATLATFPKRVKIDLGVLELTDGFVSDYIEEPTKTYAVSTGIYLFEPRILPFIPRGQRLDLPDLILDLVARKERVAAYPFEGEWLDIGRPDDYAGATQIFRERRAEFLPGG